MIPLVKRLFGMRIIRYGLVGGVGIPINDLALFGFTLLFSHILSLSPDNNVLYAIASACAFEVSTSINFVLNQLFTYREQKIQGREWLRRAGKAQLTSLSALLLSYGIALALVYIFHVNKYIANPAGIIVAFIYNFFISNKLVFRSQTPVSAQTKQNEETSPAQISQPVEATPKG